VIGIPADTEKNEPAPQTEDKAEVSFSSIEDIFAHDSQGMLDIPDDFVPPISVHKTKQVRVNKADKIAKSVPCPNFSEYAPIFDEIRWHLKAGNLKLSKFTGYTHRFEPGQIFLLNGFYVLVAACDFENVISKNHKKPYRIKLIYSNRTEVSPLNYTFLESLNLDSLSACIQAVNEAGEAFLKELNEYFTDETEPLSEKKDSNDDESGYIYILRTLSKDPALLKFQESSYLVKIGFCTTTVEERIKNAANDPTYLFAPVELITSIKCSGMNVHLFEQLIHACLFAHRFNVTLTNAEGKKFRPREWFTVSADTAVEVAMHIKDGTINQYRVDPVTGKLKRKTPKQPSQPID
ncbi:MAG: GIY-YIG nuclease family protein, partial [Proteobacteria bacterium]|nr:GIY-YIG nuclease family protein [Candidatus Avisuccinivibrio stercorigallinarum]